MAALYFLCVALLCANRAQGVPLSVPQIVPPCPPVVTPCQSQVVPTAPVVATTIVDNSVSNSLANALQLLIVSNLIENTMTHPCGLNTFPAAVTPICDAFPYQAPVYSPAIDIITPEYLPYGPFEPIISPCDVIAPCEPVIDIIPNIIYPEIVPNVGCGCGCDSPFIPNIGCGFPNIGCGCGCDSPFIPNIGCGCSNIGNCGCNYPSLANILPSILPNIGCGCNNFGCDINPFGPIIPEVLFPQTIGHQLGCSYAYGGPNYPIGISVDPWGYPNTFGNNYFY